MTDFYSIIDYKMTFCSDFHVGAGTTLIGGALHGLKVGEDGFPYLPYTQVKGLLRLAGLKLKQWQPNLEGLFLRNFGKPNRNSGLFWSYTHARYPLAAISGWKNAEAASILSEQSHIHQLDGIAKNLFSYQKAGTLANKWSWQGKIFSVEPVEEQDVAFLIACMRVEDRIGHRRSRGYGKVDWQPVRTLKYRDGREPEEFTRSLQDWLGLLMLSYGDKL